MVDRILSVARVAELLGVSRATVYREINRGRFPHPIRISTGRIGWPGSTIDALLTSRIRETAERVATREQAHAPGSERN